MKRILNNKLYQQGGGQSGNPIQQFGNATDLYEKLMSNALNTDAFKNFLNPKSTGSMINDIPGRMNRLKQAVPGAALSSLFDLAEMSRISAMQKPLFQDRARRTASRMGQDGGEQEMQQMPEEPTMDINDSFSILKQYAEDRGFTNEDGSINKNNMRELLLLLESDVEAELEREKLMEIAPLFAEEKDPEEAIRNYWNRGVIPMNRRQDVLEFGNPDVQFLQEGRNFKEPSDEAYRQKMGYKDNSPYKDMPQQTFDTDSITMEGVSEPLMAVANNGQSVVMQPGNDYYFPGATSVTEYPLNRMKMGGLLMKYQDNGEVPDNILYYANELGPQATITASRITNDQQTPEVTYDGPEIVIRDKRKNPETFTDEQLQLEFSPVADSLRKMANILDPGSNRIVQAYDTLDRRREADRLALALSEAVKMDGVAPSVYGIDDIAEKQAPQLMKDGGIPARYKSMGFTRVGQKKQSTRPGKKWMVLAKKGNQYKVVHGGDSNMKDFTQHGSQKRRDRFWDRMGGKNSAKANDKFSPLYWHKRFGTW